ncbi:MAG: hypothetical protein U0R69_03745 [Gaiellales bacterium]
MEQVETGGEVFGITAGAGQVWVSRDLNGFEGQLIHIDPDRNQVVARVEVDGRVRQVQLVGDVLWFYDASSGFLRSFDVVAHAPTGVRVPTASPYFAVGTNALWVEDWLATWRRSACHGSSSIREPSTGKESAGPLAVDAFHPIALDRVGLWFFEGSGASLALSHLDEETLTVDAGRPIDASPVDTAMDQIGRLLWIVDYEEFVTLVDLAR